MPARSWPDPSRLTKETSVASDWFQRKTLSLPQSEKTFQLSMWPRTAINLAAVTGLAALAGTSGQLQKSSEERKKGEDKAHIEGSGRLRACLQVSRLSYQFTSLTVDATAKSISPLADCKGPGLCAAGQKQKDSPPLQDLRKPFPPCSCSLCFGRSSYIYGHFNSSCKCLHPLLFRINSHPSSTRPPGWKASVRCR